MRKPAPRARHRAGRARSARPHGRRRPPNDARRDRQTDALCARTIADHGRRRGGDCRGRRARPISTRSSTTRCSATCPAVETSLARFFHDGGDADYLMIRLVARLTLLHRLRLEMDQGRPFDAACQALFVKLPMSARRALARQAERWTTRIDRRAAARGPAGERPRSHRNAARRGSWRRARCGRWPRKGAACGGEPQARTLEIRCGKRP